MVLKRYLTFIISALLGLRVLIESSESISIVGQSLTFFILILSICISIYDRHLSIRYHWILIFIIYIIAWICIGLINSDRLNIRLFDVLSSGIRYILIVFLILAAYKLRSNYYLAQNVIFVFLCVIVPLLFILGVVFYESSTYQGMERFSFPFNNPNTLGACGFVAILVVELLKNQRRYGIKTYLFFIGVLLTQILSSWSMTSIISSLFFLIVINFKFNLLRIIIIFSGFLFLGLLLWESLLDRLINSLSFNMDDLNFGDGSSVQWRFTAWLNYLKALDLRDLFGGMGAGISRELLNQGYWYNYMHFSAPGTHNDYIQILVDFGLFGMVIFITIIYLLIKNKNIYLSEKSSRLHMTTILSILLYFSFDNMLDTKIFFVFCFLFFINFFNFKMNYLDKISKRNLQ